MTMQGCDGVERFSIVFQGPVLDMYGVPDDAVMHNLGLTRSTFPGAEIILSTWTNERLQVASWRRRLEVDGIRLVLSDDPGPVIGVDEAGRYVSNVNRLLISSRAGLAAASRPLSIKIRTDSSLSDRKIIPLLELFVLSGEAIPRDTNYAVFRSRIISADWFARDARGSLPFLFHPGDIFLSGFTEDLRLFFSAPLADAGLFRPTSMPGLYCVWRYVPEQWLWVHAIHNRTGLWVYNGNFEPSPGAVEESEKWFLANFVTFPARKLGLHWPKYWRRYPFRGLFSVYSHRRWQRLARRAQGNSFRRLTDITDDVMTSVWRTGYRLRCRLLRYTLLRRLAIRLFVHR